MNRIRQAVTGLCLATTLSAAVPRVAVAGESSLAAEPASSPIARAESKLDLSQLRTMTVWNLASPAPAEDPIPVKVQTQTSEKKGAGMSTAKKTWIIVGSVLGAAVVVAAVSNHGGGGGGGGGY